MANELIQPNIVGSFLQGRQLVQQRQEAEQQNQLRAMQLQQAQQAQARDEQFRAALPAYLQGGTNGLAALYAADPERTMQAQAFMTQQNQLAKTQKVEEAKQALAQAQGVLNSEAPATYMRLLIPQVAQQWAEHSGKSVDEMTDDEAMALAEQVSTLASSQAGILPKFTNPEAGQKDGKEVFFQTDEATGRARVVPGVAPRPQKPQVQIDMGQKFEGSAERAAGEAEGKAWQAQLDRGLAAQEKSSSLRGMLSNPAITGPTQDLRAAANSFFSDLGVPIAAGKIDQISNLSQYKAMQSQMVLSEQLKQKGPQTESDAKRIAETFGNTKNIQEANKLILNYQLALADREALLAEMAEDYRDRTGKIEGWRKEQREYVRRTPLAGVDPQSKRLVFWNEFQDVMREDNPSMSEEQIMDYWRQRYGNAK
jgi:hypothetical protein